MLKPPAWTEMASCLGLWHVTDKPTADDTKELAAMCSACPVKAQCALHMLTSEVGRPVEHRATYAAGMGPVDRARADARAKNCLGCGVRTGAGPCDGCARKVRDLTSIKKPMLNCIQCGAKLGRRGIKLCTHCNPRHRKPVEEEAA